MLTSTPTFIQQHSMLIVKKQPQTYSVYVPVKKRKRQTLLYSQRIYQKMVCDLYTSGN